ncbi:hypothetical protein C5S31_10325 [ANME-1 cluster archaeon GoMg2]|nr:hypothetical protein [ANME-1 cluster archaeon GoMg2]
MTVKWILRERANDFYRGDFTYPYRYLDRYECSVAGGFVPAGMYQVV